MNRLKFPVFMMTLLSSVAVFAAAQPAAKPTAQPAPASKPTAPPFAFTVSYNTGLLPLNVRTGDNTPVMGENNTPVTQISGAGQINISVSHKKGSSLQLVFSPNNNLRSTPSSHFPTCMFSFFFPETGVPVLQKKEGDGPACSFNPQGNVLTVNIPDPKTMYAPCATPANWQQNAQQIAAPYIMTYIPHDEIYDHYKEKKSRQVRNFSVYTCAPYPKFQLSCSVNVSSDVPVTPHDFVNFDYAQGGAKLRNRCSGKFFETVPTAHGENNSMTGPFTGANCAQCYGIYPAQHY